jgi:hypothetical protein
MSELRAHNGRALVTTHGKQYRLCRIEDVAAVYIYAQVSMIIRCPQSRRSTVTAFHH